MPNSDRFEIEITDNAADETLPGSKFMRLPCNSMHGTIWFHTVVSCRFHASNRMEPYDIRIEPYGTPMEPYGSIYGIRMAPYGSIYGIVQTSMISFM